MFGKFSPEKYEEAKKTGDTPKVEKMQEKANTENEKNIEKYNDMRQDLLTLADKLRDFREEHFVSLANLGTAGEQYTGAGSYGDREYQFSKIIGEMFPPVHESSREESVAKMKENVGKTQVELPKLRQEQARIQERRDAEALGRVREGLKNINE